MAAIDIAEREGGEDTEQKAKGSGGGRTIVILAVLILLLGGAGAGVYLFYPDLLGKLTSAHSDAAAVNAKAKAADAKPKTKEPPIYVELGDSFVVNFNDGNRTRYLQVRIEAMTRDPAIASAINTHLPRIRNNLVFLLSAVDSATINTVPGKEKLRDDALKEVQGVLRDEIGKPGIEAIYFTSFVVQ